MRLSAPAKVNFGLRVTGLRADGYHLIESLFVPLALADVVTLERLPGEPRVEFVLEPGAGADVPGDATNLAARAARRFIEAAALEDGVRIRLTKHIPSPAGLGGGSSDAGAVLRGMLRWAPGRLTDDRLAALAEGLGADVPFFLAPGAALVEGIGERVTRLTGLPSHWLALAHPGRALATPAVYAAWDASASLTAPKPRPTIRRLLALRGQESRTTAIGALDAAGWRDLVANDLESPATSLCPEVAGLREEFEATRALAVGMSGSGPTVYGVFATEKAARDAADRIDGRHARTWVVKTAP